MGVQEIDTQTQLSRPLLLSCRIRLPCVGKVYTRAQAEPCPTRLLPKHLGLPQTNELGQCTPTGRYRPSTNQEDCCLPHGTHTPNDIMPDTNYSITNQLLADCSPGRASCAQSRRSTRLQAASRLQLWKDSLTDVPSSVNMGLDVAEWRGLALLASY